jgi:ligand-binding SRPBCC domain-containing protein
MGRFEYAFVVRAPLERVWDFHDDPLALPKVMTGPVRMHVHHVDRPLNPGSRILMTMQVGLAAPAVERPAHRARAAALLHG